VGVPQLRQLPPSDDDSCGGPGHRAENHAGADPRPQGCVVVGAAFIGDQKICGWLMAQPVTPATAITMPAVRNSQPKEKMDTTPNTSTAAVPTQYHTPFGRSILSTLPSSMPKRGGRSLPVSKRACDARETMDTIYRATFAWAVAQGPRQIVTAREAHDELYGQQAPAPVRA